MDMIGASEEKSSSASRLWLRIEVSPSVTGFTFRSSSSSSLLLSVSPPSPNTTLFVPYLFPEIGVTVLALVDPAVEERFVVPATLDFLELF